ncbi:hypothetical protein [Nannocystis bainbridge]|uniref:Uncharacterized protein n=1 Tax=Nannocystis bainbridge TaxID=2995303 RepID=A0ABT5DW82_9BACT|nr:hypothetical protein [Nannocystis bainbridge]MDC0717825.1 hypothetical protein [Nannocystis bainbridge]
MIAADEAIERLIALEFPADLDFFVEAWKRSSGVARWKAEYREQVRRRSRSERLLRRYWRASASRLERAHERTLAVARHGSAPAIVAVSLHFAVALAKLQDDRRSEVDVPAGFAAFPACIEDLADPWVEEVLALLAGCARMARARGGSSPEVHACFDGIGDYDPAPNDSPVAELFEPLG